MTLTNAELMEDIQAEIGESSAEAMEIPASPSQEMAFSSDHCKLKTLIDGGRAIVSDNWMDEVAQTDYGSEIRTCRNRHRCGVYDAYVAWIHDSAKPSDLEFMDGYAIGSL